MLTRNHAHLTRLAIKSLLRCAKRTQRAVEFIIVDCASSDQTHSYLRRLALTENLAVIVAPSDEPFIYARNCNRGAAVARGQYLVFANNDIEVHGEDLFVNWERAFDELPIAVAGTQTNQPGPNPLAAPDRALPQPAAMSVLPVYGFLWAVRRETFWELGALDENFDGYGCDELEFQYRAALAGHGIGVVSTFVHHDRHATFGPDIGPLAKRNNLYFFRQYGVRMFGETVRPLEAFHRLAERRESAPKVENTHVRKRLNSTARATTPSMPSRPRKLPMVSIVIPCYQRQELFNDTLWSCLEQDYERSEILVVDDASPTPIDLPYASTKIRSFRLRRNRGESAARNYAIQRARGQYIKLMDSDDLFVDPTCLRRFAEFAARTNADFIHCDAQLFIVGTGRVGTIREAEIDERLAKRNFLAPSQLLVRRSLFNEIQFPEDIRHAEDWAFTLAVYNSGKYEVRRLPQRLVTIRLHNESQSLVYGDIGSIYLRQIEESRRRGQ